MFCFFSAQCYLNMCSKYIPYFKSIQSTFLELELSLYPDHDFKKQSLAVLFYLSTAAQSKVFLKNSIYL